MKILRRMSLAVLWALAGVGIACGLLWGATTAGIIQPLVVISGSMEPEITKGDLLVAVPVPAGELRVGDVVSLPSELTGDLVTHRIESIEAAGMSEYQISMKGDNNEFPDALDYIVSGDVWQPVLTLSGWGTVLMKIATPPVALPLLAGLLALLGLSFLGPVEHAPARAAVA